LEGAMAPRPCIATDNGKDEHENPGNFASLKKITDFSNNLNKIFNFFLKKRRFSKDASKNFEGSFEVFPRKLRRTSKEASKKLRRNFEENLARTSKFLNFCHQTSK
jgi:hypothetical protein